MVRYNKFVCLLMLFGLASCGILFAQEESNMDFGLDIGIGAETFNEIDETEPITYQSLSLNPDFAIGPFGVGMDITVHYRFNGGETGNEFEIRVEDWIPTAGVTTVLDLYLPLLRYVRWGLRGEPLYIKGQKLIRAVIPPSKPISQSESSAATPTAIWPSI